MEWLYLRSAALRMNRGLSLLAVADCVVTDRLHAVLLSAHMLLDVYYGDTEQRKIGNYVDTWMRDHIDWIHPL